MLVGLLIALRNNNYKIKTLEHFATFKELATTEVIQNQEEFIKTNTILKYFSNQDINISLPESFHNLYEFVESLLEVFELDPSLNPFLQFF